MKNILQFGTLPFYIVMAPDDGGEGGGSGGGDAPTGGDGDPPADGGGDGDNPPSGGDNPTDGGGDAPTGGDGDPPASNPFPDDWREQMARGKDGAVDDKQLKILKRFNSPRDYNNAYFSLNQKISSGELKSPLPKDATDEQIAEYRRDNGIPEKPDGYLEGMGDLKMDDTTKAVLTPFLEDMHAQNASPEMVQSSVQAYQDAQAAQTEYRQELDQEVAQATEDELRSEWGGDYRGNINAANAFIEGSFPAEIKDQLLGARLADGTPLMHSADVLRSFASTGRLLNPQSTVTGKTMDSMDAMDDRIAELEKQMGNKQSDYWKSEKTQQEYRDLVGARDRMKGAA